VNEPQVLGWLVWGYKKSRLMQMGLKRIT